jgi:hypothetical protein
VAARGSYLFSFESEREAGGAGPERRTKNMPEMQPTTLDISGNEILAGLADHDENKLRPHLEQVFLQQGEVLSSAGEAIKYAYFPQDAVLSLLSFMEEGVTVEIGLIGYEGLVGFHGAMGAKTWLNGVDVRVPGKCLRMKTEVLEAEFERSKVLRDRLLRFVRYFLAQVTKRPPAIVSTTWKFECAAGS